MIVRNPERLRELPRAVEKRTAAIAVVNSKAKTAKGKIEVHVAWARDVKKPRNFPAGKVLLNSHWSVKVYASDLSS